jgi:hypothetical protein
MAFLEGGGGRPGGELEPLRQAHITPGEQERSHAELVVAFRLTIRHRQMELGEHAKSHPPATIIRELILNHASETLRQTGDKQRAKAYSTMLDAWNVIAYEHYGKWSIAQASAYSELNDHYHRTGQPVITLSEPQMRLLDALAEAADIPHRKGQTEITIPESLRNAVLGMNPDL